MPVCAGDTARRPDSDVNGKFLPQSSATRAQAAKMITVYMQVTA